MACWVASFFQQWVRTEFLEWRLPRGDNAVRTRWRSKRHGAHSGGWARKTQNVVVVFSFKIASVSALCVCGFFLMSAVAHVCLSQQVFSAVIGYFVHIHNCSGAVCEVMALLQRT